MAVDENIAQLLVCGNFPRASGYDAEWVLENQMGLHPLWLTEWLCQSLEIRPGMRILDLACGKAISSIFLAKEYGAQVWGTNLWIETEENSQRIEESGTEHSVFPVKADARALPFAEGFFDIIICVDAFIYFGTDDLYLNYVHRFLRKGGQIAIAVPGLLKEFAGPVPKHLEPFWGQDCWTWHTAEWWRRHWARTGLVDVEVVDVLPEGHELWRRFSQALWDNGNHSDELKSDIQVLTKDGGDYMGFIRAVARRR